MRDVLRVVAGVVLSARSVLLVSKRAAPTVFYLPGGKPEPGEDAGTCLCRELNEELGVDVIAAEPLLDVHAIAALERTEMEMSVFLTTVRGVPTARAEISRLAWWPERTDIEIAPAVCDAVIPHLRQHGHLPPARAAA
jgi:8-oxo-dGTP diphosphatase